MTSLGSFSLGPTVSRHASCGSRPSVHSIEIGMSVLERGREWTERHKKVSLSKYTAAQKTRHDIFLQFVCVCVYTWMCMNVYMCS